MKKLIPVIAICLAALPAVAQSSRFTGHIGGGFTEPVRDIGTRLDRGYNIGAGIGANLTDRFGLMVDFTFNRFGINQSTLNELQVPDGNTRIWGLTLNPIVYLAPSESTVNFYITGGGGLYRRTIEFTQPAVQTVTAFNPWWGVFYPANVLTNLVLGSFSTMKAGVNGGAGITVRLGSSNVKLFAEARYHHMFTPQIATNFVPVTFGFRW